MITARRKDGRPLPFGADVFDEDDASVGVVGQGGKAFVRVPRTQGQLTVRWGSSPRATCTLRYHLDVQPSTEGANRLRQLDSGTCRAGKAYSSLRD
nr:FimD/PapC C-terminal domain-containing protein [Pseudomonas cyclaminis]